MMRGSTPTVVAPMILARGFKPYCATASSEATNTAAAPSLMPEALPAVTVPSALTTPLSLAKVSNVVEARGKPSLSTTTGSPFFCGMVTAMISLSK